MHKKKTESIRCRNCNMLPNEHNYEPGDNLRCEMERLPLQIQEAYYRSTIDWDTQLKPYVIYYPMDNLMMLEYEYERRKRETPTADSLK